MGWFRCTGTSGGTSLGKYLYNKGKENTELTGGLTSSGYTFSTYHTIAGQPAFESTDIKLTVTAAPGACMFGTNIQVDLTNVSVVRVNGVYSDNTPFTVSIDVSNINGSRFLAITMCDNTNSQRFVILNATNTKSNVYTASGSVHSPTTFTTNNTALIKEIELI